MTRRKCPKHHYILSAPARVIDAKCRDCGKKRTYEPEILPEFGKGRITNFLPENWEGALAMAVREAGLKNHDH